MSFRVRGIARGHSAAMKEIAADVVVFATGYKEAWSRLFDSETAAALDPAGDGPAPRHGFAFKHASYGFIMVW